MQAALTILLAVQILTALGMIGLILIQQGKGADMGAAFGSGTSGSLFGASGSANFLSRATGVLATVFFVCTLTLAYFGNVRPVSGSSNVLQGLGTAPVLPASAATGAQLIPGAAPVPGGAATAASAAASLVSSPVPVSPVTGAPGASQSPTR
ncbi:MAG: preprotein translocase subunit SecG [Burkholderiaceae bacterium]